MLLIAAGLYLFLILATYHRSDPGWSHSATEAVTRNAGGAFGAWLSDLMLYLFGLSAYWWVALCLYLVVWGWRRMDGFRLGAALGGFAVLLLSSASLERLRLHSLTAALPLAPGGVAGDSLADVLSRGFGFTGGHTHANWADVNQRRIVANALLWSAGVEVPAGGVVDAVTAADLTTNLDDKK